MADQKPVVRHFIACEQVELFPDTRQYTLHKVIYVIRALPGAPFPRIQPAIDLFALLSDGQGTHHFWIDIVTWEATEERSIFTSREAILDLGQDPLKVLGWPIHLTDIPFLQPGLYEVRLACDGEIIAREPIMLR
jgi:hypothetical protein